MDPKRPLLTPRDTGGIAGETGHAVVLVDEPLRNDYRMNWSR